MHGGRRRVLLRWNRRFEYEAGYDYRLRIGKYDPWGGKEPPQDAGRYAYRLLEQLEKAPAPSTPATLSVGPDAGEMRPE